jgi:[ribosomal protein S18]-alanine N-acetyltransferase
MRAGRAPGRSQAGPRHPLGGWLDVFVEPGAPLSALPQDPALHRAPMHLALLPAVLAIEQAVYPFPWSHGNFVDSLVAGHAAQVLRAADGTLAAYSVAMRGVQEMHLLNLTVAPPWQRRGLACALLDTLVALCRQEHHEALWLEVRVSNQRARDVYARYGFTETGLRRGYYPAPGGQREDACVMRLPIVEGAAP